MRIDPATALNAIKLRGRDSIKTRVHRLPRNLPLGELQNACHGLTLIPTGKCRLMGRDHCVYRQSWAV